MADTELAGGTVNGNTVIASVGLGMISGGHGGLAVGLAGSITSKVLGAEIASGLLQEISRVLDIVGGNPIGVNSTPHGQSSPTC